jgi:hypothetical protein
LLAIHEPLAFQSRLYGSLQIFGGGMLITTFVSQLGTSSGTASLLAGGDTPLECLDLCRAHQIGLVEYDDVAVDDLRHCGIDLDTVQREALAIDYC